MSVGERETEWEARRRGGGKEEKERGERERRNKRERGRQTERKTETDRQIDRQKNRQTVCRQTYSDRNQKKDREADIHTEKLTKRRRRLRKKK